MHNLNLLIFFYALRRRHFDVGNITNALARSREFVRIVFCENT